MRKKKLRSLTVFLAACTVVLCAPSTASATDTTTPPDGGGTDASGGNPSSVSSPRADGMQTIDLADGTTWNNTLPITIYHCPGQCQGHTITGEFDASTQQFGSLESIVKVEGGPHNIILDNVKIDLSGITTTGTGPNIRPFELAEKTNASVNLSLKGTNTLKSIGSKAGLCTPSDTTLNIVKGDNQSSLTAVGGHGSAGIGGDGYSADSGAIFIDAPGSTLTARGGKGGCGI